MQQKTGQEVKAFKCFFSLLDTFHATEIQLTDSKHFRTKVNCKFVLLSDFTFRELPDFES